MTFIKFSFVLFSVASFVFAYTFPLRTNIDAQVTFTSGANAHSVTTVGGVSQNVTLSWLTSQMNVQVSVKTENNRFNDSTFAVTLGSNASTYPAWNSGTTYNSGDRVSHNGQNWQCGWWSRGDTPGVVGSSPSPWTVIGGAQPDPLIITLNSLPFPDDIAFIPVFSNVNVEIQAVSDFYTLTYQLPRRVRDTIMLPLSASANIPDWSFGGGQGSGSTSINRNAERRRTSSVAARLISHQGYHLLTLSERDFQNGEIRLISTNGRVISAEKLSGTNQTSVTVAGVAAGVYLLNVRGANGANFTQRIQHNGGELRFATSFSGNFEVGGILNSRTVVTEPTTAQRSSSPNYTLTFHTQGLGSRVVTLNNPRGGSGVNESVEVLFVDPNAPPSEAFQDLFSREQFERMFPNRYGFGRAECANATSNDAQANCSRGKPATGACDGTYDFYSYDALLMAIDLLGEVEVELEYAINNANPGVPQWGSYRINWRNKRTGNRRVLQTAGFTAWTRSVNLGKIDYADFVNAGTLSDRKQELAAFLANITQETSGFGGCVPGGRCDEHFHWGLYWQQEVGYTNTSGAYRTPDPTGQWNPAPNASVSYHGRGAKQLTHPYNYGQFSEFLYGDKDELLLRPDRLIPERVGNEENGILGFASAIWFWMTPQPPKPSCHQIFRSDFTPSQADISSGRTRSRIGWTISIINGGLECNFQNTINDNLGRVPNRVYHYERYIKILGEQPEGDLRLGCDGMAY